MQTSKPLPPLRAPESPAASRTKKLALTIGAIIFIVAVLVGIKALQIKKMISTPMVMPPETVTAAEVKEEVWPNSFTATGSVAPVQGVTIATEIPGRVAKVAFEPGAAVKAGDVLLQLDVSTEEAELRAAEATAELARVNAERSRDLFKKTTISQSELDATEAQAKQAAAQVEGVKAVLAKKTIRAPFDGRLGLRLVNLGQILSAGQAITVLQTLDPIYVNFSLPQQRLSALSTGHVARVTSDAAPGKVFEGKITAISPEVDASTRSVRIQATIANTEEKLRAGMFANVEVMLPTEEKVQSIPATAVLYAPYGDSVFVIEEKKNEQSGQMEKVLRQQFVRLGGARGDFVKIVDGLKPGESVVTSGVFKLRPGAPVVIDNKLAPPAKLDPKPNNT